MLCSSELIGVNLESGYLFDVEVIRQPFFRVEASGASS